MGNEIKPSNEACVMCGGGVCDNPSLYIQEKKCVTDCEDGYYKIDHTK